MTTVIKYYYCTKCKRYHHRSSQIYQLHWGYQRGMKELLQGKKK